MQKLGGMGGDDMGGMGDFDDSDEGKKTISLIFSGMLSKDKHLIRKCRSRIQNTMILA